MNLAQFLEIWISRIARDFIAVRLQDVHSQKIFGLPIAAMGGCIAHRKWLVGLLSGSLMGGERLGGSLALLR